MSRVSVELVVCESLALPDHAHRRGGDDVSRLLTMYRGRLRRRVMMRRYVTVVIESLFVDTTKSFEISSFNPRDK